jgi:hypothetical protein
MVMRIGWMSVKERVEQRSRVDARQSADRLKALATFILPQKGSES